MFILQISNHHPSEWIEVDDAGNTISREMVADLSHCPKIDSRANLAILFPGEDVTITSVKLPKISASEKLQAIPFALEEKLASDPDNILAVLGADHVDGSQTVAVIEKNNFESHMNAWHSMQLFPRCVSPDFLALILLPENWSVLLQNNMALVRMDFQNGFACDANNLFLFLENAFAKNPKQKPKRLIVWQHHVVLDATQLEKLGVPIELRDAAREIPWDVNALSTQPALNLLQGKYRAKTPHSDIQKKWKQCTIAASALIGFIFLGNIAQWIYFSHEANQSQAKIESVYRTLFPSATQILEPHFRAAALLKRLQSESQGNLFLRLFSASGDTLLHFPDIEIQSLSFRHEQLLLTLQTNSITALTNYARELSAMGFWVTQQTSKTAQGSITAIITVKVK